jgi:hypothetical protein
VQDSDLFVLHNNVLPLVRNAVKRFLALNGWMFCLRARVDEQGLVGKSLIRRVRDHQIGFGKSQKWCRIAPLSN